MGEAFKALDFYWTPSTLLDCVEDLLNVNETCEVLNIIHLHQSSNELCVSIWVVHIEGQLAETIPNVTVYMRVEGVVKKLVA